MTRYTECDGVFFTEDSVEIEVIKQLVIKAPNQNTSLLQMKQEMARQVRLLGGNGVVRYSYVQKADKPLKNVFSFKWDTERLTLTGEAVKFDGDPRNEG